MTASDPLLQPFTLKHLTLKNRVVSTAHEPAYTDGRMPGDRYLRYQAEKAKGGIGLTMFGGSCTVSADSPAAFGNIDASTDEVVKFYADLSDTMHKHGAAIMNQITHLGRRTSWSTEHWLPIVSPSTVREMAHRMFPKVAEKEDIDRIAKDFGQAALRSKLGGLDGLEVESYGHLFDAFASPLTNKRQDEYGGSLENRLRFGMQVLEEIRKAVGDDYIVGLRISIDERLRGGIDKTEGFEIVRRFVETGMVDFLSVIVGSVDSDETLSHVIPVMGTPAAPNLAVVGEVKQAFDLPVMHAAKIADVATARHAIESGAMDLVGMTRAHMTDPHIVAKLMRGEEERIRPCVGAGYCIDNIYISGAAYCIHNPATGREKTVPQLVPPSQGPAKKAVVVGAGPAGLEAARVLALRGHTVVLFEAAERAGGQVVIAAKAPRRRDLIGIVDWLTAEAERAGVEIRYNTYAEQAEIAAENPDLVIIATGGLPNTAFLEEGEDLVVTSWDVLSGQVAPADTVLMYDENGRQQGPSAAEFMAEAGSTVHFVTPDRMVGPDIGVTNNPSILKGFYDHGIKVSTDHRLLGVKRDGNKLIASLYNIFTHQISEQSADQVVTEYATVAADDVYFEVKNRSKNNGQTDIDAIKENRPQESVTNPNGDYFLFRVGDAVNARDIHAAIFDSRRLCQHL
ncbi:N-methylproline demethylase [Hwanghaeella grinnelliae]|uniref:N-methylproline demethylase n=1 Tax=Hwanghaeella grinnelliae TaxID=2500179 RepID=A0A3S2WC04_9PROT|nr:FAD-dependent oxidoreductase [Hwanghaeella grinnelliae]RVU38956.1 N-methylproline demethylase [Hwanghaeella grinnelliae]